MSDSESTWPVPRSAEFEAQLRALLTGDGPGRAALAEFILQVVLDDLYNRGRLYRYFKRR